MPYWLKIVSAVIGGAVALWTVIDAVRGYWGLYREFGAGVQATAHYWLSASPVRAVASVAIVSAAVAALAFYIWAARSPNVEADAADESVPGTSIQMYLQVNMHSLGKRHYILDMGTRDRERLSIYVTADNILTVLFSDAYSEPHPVQLPLGPKGFPVGRLAHLGCELGVTGDATMMRVAVDGVVVARINLPYKTNIGALNVPGLTLGTDMDGQNGGFLALAEIIIFNETRTTTQLKDIAERFRKNALAPQPPPTPDARVSPQ
ncbi:MAG TPA: hypothetical protein VK993_15885 [Chthoniobacterales bacterium]|nr:hypothetical protein [Chthoniobacterales bacterium]